MWESMTQEVEERAKEEEEKMTKEVYKRVTKKVLKSITKEVKERMTKEVRERKQWSWEEGDQGGAWECDPRDAQQSGTRCDWVKHKFGLRTFFFVSLIKNMCCVLLLLFVFLKLLIELIFLWYNHWNRWMYFPTQI